jgi:hypothetical protein
MNTGLQDVFYFETSNLLPKYENYIEYTNLYKKIPVIAVLGWVSIF